MKRIINNERIIVGVIILGFGLAILSIGLIIGLLSVQAMRIYFSSLTIIPIFAIILNITAKLDKNLGL